MINNDWDIVLEDCFNSNKYLKINKLLEQEYSNKIIFPKSEEIFKALELCSYEHTKVVILGQDPYHGDNEANGLAFSVKEEVKMPPSLKNIFKELESDIGIKRSKSDLSDWAKQGVLLLNTVLTVEKDKPLSHRGIGWEEFTDCVIKKLANKKEPIVFILWGNNAKQKKHLINSNIHMIIESTHPSPFSAHNGFFNSKPFSRTNTFLRNNNKEEIKW
jgi:uracil-DNA glycosylase